MSSTPHVREHGNDTVPPDPWLSAHERWTTPTTSALHVSHLNRGRGVLRLEVDLSGVGAVGACMMLVHENETCAWEGMVVVGRCEECCNVGSRELALGTVER